MRRKITLELVLGKDLGGHLALHGPAGDFRQSRHHLIHLGKDGGRCNGGRASPSGRRSPKKHGHAKAAPVVAPTAGEKRRDGPGPPNSRRPNSVPATAL